MRTRTLCWAAICTLVLMGCGPGGGVPPTINISVNRNFTDVCKIDEYTALCWTVGFEPPPSGYIHNFSIDMTNPLTAIPTGTKDGQIDFKASGTFRTRLRPKISPALLAGTPPPWCAAVNPIDGPNIGVLVVDWTVHGNYITTLGDSIECKDGYKARNILIKERTLSIQQFDIRDVWDWADKKIKDLVKSTIRAEIDRQVHSYLVLDCLFHDGPSEDAPIHAGGGESGGFCK